MSEVIQFRPKALSGDAPVSKTGERGSIPRGSANPFDTPVTRAIDHLFAMQEKRNG